MPTGRGVLLADDDEAFARSCARVLRKDLEVECVHSVAAALGVIRFGAALGGVWSDGRLPDPGGGVEILRAAAERYPDAVLVLVTGDPDAQDLAELPKGVRVFSKEKSAEAMAYFVGELPPKGT